MNWLRHRIENKQKGHSSRSLCSLCPHVCRITHVHYAGSGQSIAFSGLLKRWTGYSVSEFSAEWPSVAKPAPFLVIQLQILNDSLFISSEIHCFHGI